MKLKMSFIRHDRMSAHDRMMIRRQAIQEEETRP
jgi:hypothetical protein